MTPERWREVEQVYQSTMDREPRLRAAFLSDACKDDEGLLHEVESLLKLNNSPAILDAPAWQAVAELFSDSTELAPGTQLGPYRIEALLGAGGMGRVYQSHDTRLGRTVALKISRVEFNERFEREARAVAALNHPNVCTIHDVGPNYLVMELVEGPTLADHIKEGPIPLEEALRIARQIADALEAAHEKGIIHRDLKPGNIKIKPDGTVKVLDFGLAKLRPVDAASGAKPEDSPTISMAATSAGMILGTAAYMSPEQARGKVVDKRADIWAFGVVLYEMVTGRRLFEGEDVTETLALVIKGQPKWDGIPLNVQRLLKSCLEKDPKRRLRDIADAWPVLEAASTVTIPTRSHFGTLAWIVAAVAVAAASALTIVHLREKPPSAELVRLQISPPPQTGFAGSDTLVSPDGRSVAFELPGVDGRDQLWVRSLDSVELRPLAGTEGANNGNFWSPDSRSIGFQSQGKLKRVDVSGGPPQTLCSIPVTVSGSGRTWVGGAWGRDGVIIFGTASTGLWRVPDTGGTPTEVTLLNTALKDVFHAGPAFLPDGRHFLYDRVGQGDRDIYLGSLDARPEEHSSKRLLENVSSSAIFASASGPDSGAGYVIFTRERSLMAQPFDLRRLALTGEAVPIAEGFGAGGARRFSASLTGVLAYRFGGAPGEAWGWETQLTWFSPEGKVLGNVGDRGEYNNVALSPDGTRVAVSRNNSRSSVNLNGRPLSDIWVNEIAGSAASRLTTNQSRDLFPIWSPDGSRIIYSSQRRGSPLDLYQTGSSGAANQDLLLQSNEEKAAQDWSRDGRFLLYSVTTSEGGAAGSLRGSHDLWVLPLTSGDRKPEPYLETQFDENQGQFSPDGRFIAYRSDLSGRDEIYVQPFPAASQGKWPISEHGGSQPRWRGDGKELFYISDDSKMMAVEVSTNPVFKAGPRRALFQTPIRGGRLIRQGTRYDVTADGKKFLINSIPPEDGAAARAPIMVVLNWTGLLKK